MPPTRNNRKSTRPVEKVKAALHLIDLKHLSIRKAAKESGLSYVFLHRRLSGNTRIDSRSGPDPVFNSFEETAMSEWLCEMERRGMGLKPKEFLQFVHNIVKKEKRKNPFTNGHPGHKWYYSFMARNCNTVRIRTEVPLEACRSKLTREQVDNWYCRYRDFIIEKGLLESPSRIWNADETGFCMGSTPGKVIGPIKEKGSYHIPHVTGGSSKERLTALFCASADGRMMPPFLVYPAPKPQGCNPLTGGLNGSAIEYTKKGWMTADAFLKFINHFDKHAGPERPVLLLIDSVSSHVDMSVFQSAAEKGIEIYRLLPNATHLMQPLDRGVFGPLKLKWHQVVRKHYREHPGAKIGKLNFSEKLKEVYYEFYKPLTVINSFKVTGIYPIDSTKIGDDELKPAVVLDQKEMQPQSPPATEDYEDTMLTEDENSESDITIKPIEKIMHDSPRKYPIDVNVVICKDGVNRQKLVDYDDNDRSDDVMLSSYGASFFTESTLKCYDQDKKNSPAITDFLIYPKAQAGKPKLKSLLQTLPDNLTSDESIRKMALKDLEKTRSFAEREKKAKQVYVKNCEKQLKKQQVQQKRKKQGKQKVKTLQKKSEDEVLCIACEVSWVDDQENCHKWVGCHVYDGWIHEHCIPIDHDVSGLADEKSQFVCHLCL
ncbi:uncharacterized protein LOC121377863 [Gigantopelta aegis]|uniref:uncharacterized protein LOC121377863 n=1 Tax=Gigantopelta aegis TaxID=1735272 RepID=UPI001B8890D4|nr:uncharacterized protein LOC121377863 [Gigantopelta aegis]